MSRVEELERALERLIAATNFALAPDAPADAWVFVAGATVVARQVLEGERVS
jgi:cytosine/adenosine deaminase-related metal-dependent hydrolase